MRESFRVDVMNGLDELLRVVAHNALLEGTRVGDVIKKLTTWDKLAHDECYLHKLATFLFPGGVELNNLEKPINMTFKTLQNIPSTSCDKQKCGFWNETLKGLFNFI